jgi:cold shock CspA family protein
MTTENATSETTRYIGQVKWFNNRAGYGFITMTDESGTEKDVFAHFSTIKMDQTQYKFLMQGEYVEFEMSPSNNEKHEFQATNITGIKGGQLMCESRQQAAAPPHSYRPRGPPRGYYRHYGPARRGHLRRDHEDDGFQRVERRNRRRDDQ